MKEERISYSNFTQPIMAVEMAEVFKKKAQGKISGTF